MTHAIAPLASDGRLAKNFGDGDLELHLGAVQEATDDLLNRQFTALSAALGDDVPAVRTAAVAGVCTVLDAYWDLIPAATTAAFVQRLASEQLHPRVTEPTVMAAACNGIIMAKR